MTPEARVRQTIDVLLMQAGWHVCKMSDAYIHAACGVALCEFPLNPGYGFADYLLYIDCKAAGVIEAKKEGATLTGVEVQSARYAQARPGTLHAWCRLYCLATTPRALNPFHAGAGPAAQSKSTNRPLIMKHQSANNHRS